jgi:hypothetical protein
MVVEKRAKRPQPRGQRAKTHSSELGLKSFTAAQDTFVGIELMPVIKKRQLVVAARDEGLTAAEQVSALAASSSHRLGLVAQNLRHSQPEPQLPAPPVDVASR